MKKRLLLSLLIIFMFLTIFSNCNKNMPDNITINIIFTSSAMGEIGPCG